MQTIENHKTLTGRQNKSLHCLESNYNRRNLSYLITSWLLDLQWWGSSMCSVVYIWGQSLVVHRCKRSCPSSLFSSYSGYLSCLLDLCQKNINIILAEEKDCQRHHYIGCLLNVGHLKKMINLTHIFCFCFSFYEFCMFFHLVLCVM